MFLPFFTIWAYYLTLAYLSLVFAYLFIGEAVKKLPYLVLGCDAAQRMVQFLFVPVCVFAFMKSTVHFCLFRWNCLRNGTHFLSSNYSSSP